MWTSENQKSWLWRHCRRRAIFDYSDHPRKLVTLNPKLKSTGAGRYQLLSVGGMPTASSLAWKTSLEKSNAVALPWLRAWRFTYDWSSVCSNQAIDRCSNIWASPPGAGYGQFEHKADSLIAKFKARPLIEENWCMSRSPRLSPLWLSASSSACHGLLIITVITPLPTKPSATKMPENWSWRTLAITDACRCVSVMLLRSMQNTRRVSWC